MSTVIDSTDAPVPTDPGTSAAGKVRRGRIPGEVGIWVLIFADVSTFAYMFGLYVFAYGHNRELFSSSQAGLSQTFGAVNTLLLLTSSLFVFAGTRAAQSGARALAPRLYLVGMALGLAFAVNKYFEYGDHLRHGITPGTNDFWMYYYILTGFHLMHLITGLVVLGFVVHHARRARPTANQAAFVEAGSCFWHMVDLVWIFLFPLVYLVR